MDRLMAAAMLTILSIVYGCSSVVIQPFKLAGLECEAVEVRPSTLSTITVATCKQEGKAMNLVSAQGTPQANVILEGISQAASVGQIVGGVTLGIKAATILGKSLEQAGKNIEKPWPSRVCTTKDCISPDAD